jgi:hypothetical protein
MGFIKKVTFADVFEGTLNSMEDARRWAFDCGVDDALKDGALAKWIWQERPYDGVTFEGHPLSRLSEPEFWEACGDNDALKALKEVKK